MRGLERSYLNTVVDRVYNIALGAALMTETKLTITEIKQYDNVVNVPSFMELGMDAMKTFGIPDAKMVQPWDTASGSTDFGIASSQIGRKLSRVIERAFQKCTIFRTKKGACIVGAPFLFDER